MIRPKEMQFVRVIGPNSRIGQVIETLYDLKLLHLVDFKKSEKDFMDIGRPLEDAPAYSEQLVKARSMISYFGLAGKPRQLEKSGPAKKLFNTVEKRFRRLTSDIEKLRAEEAVLVEMACHPMAVLGLKARMLSGVESVKVFLGRGRESIRSDIEGAVKDCQLLEKEQNGEFYTALVVRKEDAEKAQDILHSAGVTEYPIAEGADFSRTKARLDRTRKNIAGAKKSLETLKRKDGDFLLDYELTLSIMNDKAEAPLRFASTKNAFVASGWVPREKAAALSSAVSEAIRGKVEVELLETEAEPPTVLENIRAARPFEFFLNLYSLPRHYEIDPTFIMFITFPLFFGFMLGDVGYGLFILIMTFFIGKIMPNVKVLVPLMILPSISTIIFGFVFGEFFGYEFLHPVINRMSDMNQMMLITIVVGFIHVTLGLALGFRNELIKHGLMHAMLAKGSWLLIEMGGVMLVFSSFYNMHALQIPGAAILLAAVAMLFKGEGIRGIVELPGIFSNIMSYTRLYAIGLASVALAAVFNEQAFALIGSGGINILLAGFILIMGHFINLLLGIMGPFLQAMRLHYVEFFSKFFEGGGTVYRPFGSRQ